METSTPTHISNTTKRTNLELNSSFLFHHGFNPCPLQISDIEMIALQSVTYTSLKDLLPPSPPSIKSPTKHNSSWQEIPIKNKLVKQAALAYLQPMSTPREVGEKGLFGKIRDWFCNECGCLGWLHGVVFWSFSDETDDDNDNE